MDNVLEALENNARISWEDLAKLTKHTPGEIKRLIKQYEKKGIIVKYKTMLNKVRLHCAASVVAIIEVKVTPQKDVGFDQIARRIYRFPEVKNCYLLSGTYDLLLVVEGKDIHAVANFVAEKLAPLNSIKGTVSHFMLKKYKEDGVILVKDGHDKRLAVAY